MNRDIPALIGCIINEMHKNNCIEAAQLMDEARIKVIEQLTMSQSKSYRKSYPLLFNLQLIEELEESQVTSETPERAKHLENLEARWKKTFGNIVPHTQHQLDLLHLRKAAYFDIRSSDDESATISKNILLHIVSINRKAGNMIIADDALQQAEQQSNQILYRERAKLLWKKGRPKEAADLLMPRALSGEATFEEALLYVDIDLQHALEGDAKNMVKIINREGQLEGEKAEKANILCIKWYGKRLNETHEEHLQINIKTYLIKRSISALQRGSKYYYTSMSTLLNCWFDIANIGQQMRKSSTPRLTDLSKKVTDASESMLNITNVVPLYQFIVFLPRLISNLLVEDDILAGSLAKIILEVFGAYPRHTIWLMLGAIDSPVSRVRLRIRQIFEKARTKFSNSLVPAVIQDAFKLREALYELSSVKVSSGTIDMGTLGKASLLHLRDLQLHMPGERCLLPNLPEIITKSTSSYDPFGFDPCGNSLPQISRFEPTIAVMKSLQMPKRITAIGSDGKEYRFLLKKEDDLRKDARTMEFNNMINTFLKKNPEARDSGLYIRTYSVVPLGNRWGLIEWIDNLFALKAVVNEYLMADGFDGVSALAAKFDAYKLGTASEKVQGFEKVLASSPPTFYKWFLRNFPEPNQWLNSRTRFIKTLAVMSIVGYCIGLGDRHAENITFDETNGDCVHVDLNLLFEGGSSLPTPEIVPFRLTHNLVDAMGILGYSGTFKQTCELTLKVLLDNQETLLTVYETHLNELQTARDLTGKQSLRIERNPATETMNKLRAKFDTKAGQIGERVAQLIQAATSKQNLSQMYVGWAPFI
ncbi:Serine/threonine-protein kinase ATR [Choanephora cucurbitarum]|uniref:non-specific serine/threonine protein kinase n=1 Tax=Choanephora cucurbitarum TaxID=101091 RepID=A0A1C7NKH4_9FUNG|nr:Serine/threonine-protein kinase ATR [Choanephora cucurbitarum]